MRALIRELIETVILALLIFLALQVSVQSFRVEGPSMQPTLQEGQRLLVNKLVYFRIDPDILSNVLPFLDVDRDKFMFPFHPPRRGEVVIFRFPGDESRDFVKRVIGVPGDTVEIHQGEVSVNGEKLDEPYITHRDRRDMDSLEVPPESYFVLGDNRRASNDSRDWGTVPEDDFIGRAWVSYWPFDRFDTLRAFRWP